ncbi:hypothetical protein [Stutzerimonas azotifigens]|uniref:hypothetical protein n=1 Tax=Stutzerimonas azotifigens TaxID=291995 RepID=UPI00041DD23E|nr:hypothetical protein [Stutzerimonas azotifigens]
MLYKKPGNHHFSSLDALFAFSIQDSSDKVFSCTDEEGLVSGINDTGSFVRIIFLLNSCQRKVSKSSNTKANYIFYLDAEPVERPVVPLHFQLVFSPTIEEPTFKVWAATVMRYLCACFVAPAIPAFDNHDISSVLLGATSSLLSFNLVRGEGVEQMQRPLRNIPPSKHLLAVLFSPPSWSASNEYFSLPNESIPLLDGGLVKGGCAFHPYKEQVLMLLGD